MAQYYLPIVWVLVSNTLYHICSKSIPSAASPMVMLIVTYAVAAAASFAVFMAVPHEAGFVSHLKLANWAPIVLGLCIFGLEVGFIIAYRVGWHISVASLITSVAVSLVLVAIGLAFYKEHMSAHQFVGIALCVAGLILVNRQ